MEGMISKNEVILRLEDIVWEIRHESAFSDMIQNLKDLIKELEGSSSNG